MQAQSYPNSSCRRLLPSHGARTLLLAKPAASSKGLWRDYRGPIGQITVTDLGHEEPTLVLANQTAPLRSAPDRPLRPSHAHRERHRRRHRSGIV